MWIRSGCSRNRTKTKSLLAFGSKEVRDGCKLLLSGGREFKNYVGVIIKKERYNKIVNVEYINKRIIKITVFIRAGN